MSQSDQPEWFELSPFTACVDVPIQSAGVCVFLLSPGYILPGILFCIFSAILIEIHSSSVVRSKRIQHKVGNFWYHHTTIMSEKSPNDFN